MRVKHYANIDDKGKLILSNPDAFKKDLCNLKGKRVYVVVDEGKPTRSNEQNKYYWGVILQLLSEHTGYTEEEMHEILLDKFADKKEARIQDEVHFITTRSSNMKTDRFEKYLSDIRTWALSDLNVLIPLPNETINEEN